MLKRIRKHKYFYTGIVVAVGGVGISGGLAWYFRQDIVSTLLEMRDVLGSFLRQTHPAVFFLLLAVLPAFGVPVSLFYLVSAVYGIGFSLISTAAALAANLVLIYWLGVGVFHPFIERLIRRTRYSVPRVSPSNYSKITLMVRITPGLPYFIQGYLLAMGGIPFGIYFIISWVVQMCYATAIIILGKSAFQGESGMAVLGICLFLVLVIAGKIIRDRYANNDRNNSATSG